MGLGARRTGLKLATEVLDGGLPDQLMHGDYDNWAEQRPVLLSIAPKSFHTLMVRLGERAGMPFPIYPHMLWHGCGYALANAGHDTRAIQAWMGQNIQHTVRYTELVPDRFKNFWKD
jgi:Phage integrase family